MNIEIPFYSFCGICGHTIPDESKVGGTFFGTFANHKTGQLKAVIYTVCTECLEKQTIYMDGGSEAARKRESEDIRINVLNAKKRGL